MFIPLKKSPNSFQDDAYYVHVLKIEPLAHGLTDLYTNCTYSLGVCVCVRVCVCVADSGGVWVCPRPRWRVQGNSCR